MNRFLLLLICCGFSAILYGQERQHRIVFDFSKSDTASFSTMMRQANNIMSAAANAQLEIVCHGPGLDLLLKERSTVQNEMQELNKKYKVIFVACEASMRRRGIDKAQLLPFVLTVPLASLEISSRQQDGYSYIKAGQ